VADTLLNKPGHIYVCGGVNMAEDVSKSLSRIFVETAKLTQFEADSTISKLKVFLK